MMQFLTAKQGGNWWPLAEGSVPSDQFVAGDTLQQCQGEFAPANASMYQNSWVSQDDWKLLSAAGGGAILLSPQGEKLAWLDDGSGISLTASDDSFFLLFPWDLLKVNEQIVGALTENVHIGEVSPAANIEGIIHVGAGSRILPGVFIEGNAVIGENCKIGPNCYIRGNTAIGDGVHIGQAVEVKNSIVGHGSSVGHLSYVGDSVIGSKVNFGAATVTSNLRHDGKNHRTSVDGTLLDTGRRKLGTIVGDHVHTGIHTAIYPGRKLGPYATTRPNESVERDIFE
jgi:UDP-N-acetylglucosamine diphosphorylase / glucose-1-phosphate thymidylyltransferase / UDP-N-acetylgalactosamine diphosphorylase / glucosamine-1-phosphate N-acetyltransferase / galactosamine-1-phosphate N-acetyltransferase